jgi:hypothetical protein
LGYVYKEDGVDPVSPTGDYLISESFIFVSSISNSEGVGVSYGKRLSLETCSFIILRRSSREGKEKVI